MPTKNFKDRIKPQLSQPYRVLEVYGDGTGGDNEVARLALGDGTEIVSKVMIVNKKYHQRRKALTEVTMYLLDHLLGGQTVVPDLYAELYEPTPVYWSSTDVGRICQIVRGYAPAQPGDEWRGEVYRQCGNLDRADLTCQDVIAHHPDAERISVLDFLTINQDRSARNWVTDHGRRFYAIDNGMAWFHEYPESDEWKQGCVVDDVILQVNPWLFISGVFTTTWAGRHLSDALREQLGNFDRAAFKAGIEQGARDLGFEPGISGDWRYLGLLRRLDWMVENGRQPTAKEYRDWHKGSELMTPPEIVATGGKIIWSLDWDRCEAIAI